MSEMFLTPDEVKQLTGRIQHKFQARELNHLGIIYKIRADGSVFVLRAHVESVLGAPAKRENTPPAFEPNWAALEEMQNESAKSRFGKKK